MLHNQKKGYLITLIYSDIFSMYVLSKHQNRKLLNQIIDSPNISTLNNTSVQVYKHGIQQSVLLGLKIAKIGL